MVFTKRLRAGIRSGRIRCSIRIWTHPHVKVGGRYPMDEGHIVVDSFEQVKLSDITDELAQEGGFGDVTDLLQIAKHGKGKNVYLIRFHYLPPGAWDAPRSGDRIEKDHREAEKSTLLQRIRRSTPPAAAKRKGQR